MKKVLFLLLIITVLSCNYYGSRMVFDQMTVYYTNDITKSEATKFGNYFASQGLASGTPTKFQLARPVGTYYEVRFFMPKEIFESYYENQSRERKAEKIAGVQEITSSVSRDVFDDEIVIYIFWDPNLDNSDLMSVPMIQARQ